MRGETGDREFPVLGTRQQPGAEAQSLPWAFLWPHERWALANHGQGLVRLADRGGLTWCEILAVIEHRSWRRMPDERAKERVLLHLSKWQSEGG